MASIQTGGLARLGPGWLTRRSNDPKVWAMLIVIILVLAGVGFYAFIGTAPQEAVQIMLVLFWGFIIIAGFIAEFFY